VTAPPSVSDAFTGWLFAGAAWAGPGRWLGPCALPVRSGFQIGADPVGVDPVTVHPIPEAAPIRRLRGVLLPGLRDAHVHTALIDVSRLPPGGIAAVGDLGGVPEDLARLRTAAADPASGLPRVEHAGPFLTVPGGYPSNRSWAPPGSWRALRSGDDASSAVGELLAAGVARVKVALNADAGPVCPPALLVALVSAAHAAGIEVVAHVEGAGMVEVGLDAGIDQFAHVPWTHPLDPAVLRAAAAQQSAWISTLAIHHRPRDQATDGRSGPGRRPGHGSRAAAVARANLRGFLEMGGRVLYGTDLGNGDLRLGVNVAEVRALSAAGLSADDVLAAMTDVDPVTGSRFLAGVAPCLVPGGRIATGFVRDDVLPSEADRFAPALARAHVVPPVPTNGKAAP
jgi:Amidohydrolase family